MNDLFEMFVEKSIKKNKNIIQKKSYFRCFFATFCFSISSFKSIKHLNIASFASSIISKIHMIMKNLFVIFAKKQFKKNLNIIQKRIRFSMRQIQIINCFKFNDQSNFISINSFKANIFINRFNSTFRICFSINQNAKISQIAIDKIKLLIKSFKTSNKSFKYVVFINCFCSTFRFFFQLMKMQKFRNINI